VQDRAGRRVEPAQGLLCDRRGGCGATDAVGAAAEHDCRGGDNDDSRRDRHGHGARNGAARSDGPLLHAGEQIPVERVLIDVGRRRTGGAQATMEVIGQVVVFHWVRSFVVIS
jgi:hypothetical protein